MVEVAVVVVVNFVGKRALGIIFMKRIVVAVRLLLILFLHRSLLDNGRLYCHPLLPLPLLLLWAIHIHTRQTATHSKWHCVRTWHLIVTRRLSQRCDCGLWVRSRDRALFINGILIKIKSSALVNCPTLKCTL